MAVVATHLLAQRFGTLSGLVTTCVTNSFTPVANRLILVAVVNTRVESPDLPVLTGNGLTYALVASILYGASKYRLSLFRSMGAAPSPGSLTVTFPRGQYNCDVTVEQVATTKIGNNGADAVVQSASEITGGDIDGALTVDLIAFISSLNGTFGAFGSQGNGPTVGGGFTKLAGDGSSVQQTLPLGYMTEWKTSNDITVDAGSVTAGIAIELAGVASVSVGGTLTPTGALATVQVGTLFAVLSGAIQAKGALLTKILANMSGGLTPTGTLVAQGTIRTAAIGGGLTPSGAISTTIIQPNIPLSGLSKGSGSTAQDLLGAARSNIPER